MKRTPLKRTQSLKSGGKKLQESPLDSKIFGNGLKRSKLRQRSLKEAKSLKQYAAIRAQLLEMCGGKSELSGLPTVAYELVIHHIQGRRGKDLTNVFNLLVCKSFEHEEIHAHNTFEQKQKLLALVKPIRIAQGFVEADYGAARS